MRNSGIVDRVLRIALGFALISQVIMEPLGPAVWGWVGIIPLITGLIGWCPLYTLLGFRTCPLNK